MKYNLWYIFYVKYCMNISYKLWHNNFKIVEWFTEWIRSIWIQMIGQLILNYRHYYYIRLRVTCFIYFSSLYDINYIIISVAIPSRTLNQQAPWMIFQNRVECVGTNFWKTVRPCSELTKDFECVLCPAEGPWSIVLVPWIHDTNFRV